MSPPFSRKDGDLKTPPLEDLSWKPPDWEPSLNAVFAHVRDDALGAIHWYVKARVPKRRVAVTARLFAITLLGSAAILPLLDGILFTDLPPVWISIIVALGAGAIAFDRWQGSSSGWIRYIKTELRIRDVLEAFELDWQIQRAAWQGNGPSAQQVEGMLLRAKGFAEQINAIVQEETNAWVEEFQSSIKQIDEALKARAEAATSRAEAARRGAINLSVTNGDQCDGGWKVSVDDRAERRYAGKSAALGDLQPGVRVVKVKGTITGNERSAEAAVTVPAGVTVDKDVTLS
jgi:hypothetical protein